MIVSLFRETPIEGNGAYVLLHYSGVQPDHSEEVEGLKILRSMARMHPPFPTPIVVPPSQDFDGNDGPWSSFYLQVGSPPQDIKVLISTAGYQTWAVVPQGCIPSDPPDCATSRGGQFVSGQSSTWRNNNASTNGIFTLELETNLGYSGNGVYGYDTLVLGYQGGHGPSLQQQIIAGIATKEFFLGIFGLNPRSTNFSTFDNPVPSYMATLKNESLIPSLSWAYTAGNQYRPGTALGSLTLGGFDSSRFLANNVTFEFNPIDDRDLTVNIDKITMSTINNSVTLMENNIAAYVDSTVPYFYLPLDVCQQFEDSFGIVWDNDVQAYLVNDTLHNTLQRQNATVTFTIGNATQSVNISMPYAAFDLIAEYPLVTNTTRYFPLMRATNESQYTLGRAFLQEVYLIADYERRNFSISQCSWIPGIQENIVAIESPYNSTVNAKSASGSSTTALDPGRIAAIIICSIAGLFFFIILAFAQKRKITTYFRIRVLGKPDLSVKDTPPHQDEAFMAKTPATISRRGEIHEIDGCMYPGAELEFDTVPREMSGNEEVGYELAVPNAQPSELPS